MEQSNFNFEGLSEEDIRMAKESAFNGYFNSQNQMDCSFGLNFDMDKNTQGDVELKEKVVEDEKIMNLHNEAVHYMEKAFECLKEAAEQNHVESLYKLGLCYYTGFGVKEDRKKAMSIYSQAAEKQLPHDPGNLPHPEAAGRGKAGGSSGHSICTKR